MNFNRPKRREKIPTAAGMGIAMRVVGNRTGSAEAGGHVCYKGGSAGWGEATPHW